MNIPIITQPGSTIVNKTGGWRTYKPETDLLKCISCGTCARVCPDGIVSMQKKGDKLKPITNLNYCKGCGLCALECPVKAINMIIDTK
jgi:pyruvate ferredoxin oxidoreductase delta subunit